MEQRTSSAAAGAPSTSSTSSSRAPRAPSVLSLKHSSHRGASGQHHKRGQSSEEQSQPPSPMTYFPNPSTFTSSQTPQYVPSVSTSPAMSSGRLQGSLSRSSLSSSGEGDFDSTSARTPLVVVGGHELQQQQQLYFPAVPTSGGQSWRAEPTLRRIDQPTPLATSPRAGGSGVGGRRRSSAATANRALSTPIGYGATQFSTQNPSGDALGLGVGEREGRDSRDSRRIASTSGIVIPPPPSANATLRSLDSPTPMTGFGIPNHPGHGAYYASSSSQPASMATTPRFRDKERRERELAYSYHRQSDTFAGTSYQSGHTYSSHLGTGLTPSASRHRHHLSVSSALPAIGGGSAGPLSPSGSVFRRLKKTASTIGLGIGRSPAYDADDAPGADFDIDDDDVEDEGRRANGTRVWYSSYVTIDWLHDAIKESSRIRRLRHLARRSWRGAIINSWDRLQGWFIVTAVGILTAFVAFLIIRSEMALFDLKEGFCARSWGTAKRFCCAPRAGRGHPDPSSGDEEICEDWIQWGQFFTEELKDGTHRMPEIASFWAGPEFLAYFLIAMTLATTASALTVYLTSSANHITSKDSQFLGPSSDPRAQPDTPLKSPSERQPLLELPSSPVDAPRPIIYMAAGSGIPEIKTILSGFVIHGYLGMSTLVVKSIGLALSVASGLSLGKEGPFVHIATCIANIISRVFIKYEQNEGKRREVLSAACAAGVAVSFGAPIGGVLFSLEEVSYYFPPKVMWRSFWCAAVAAITLKALNPYGNGSIVLFAVTYTKDYHHWEYAIFLLLGLFGGLYGALFSRLNIIWSREVRKGTWLRRYPILEVALVTAITTFLSFLNPYTRLGGTELVAKLFTECTDDASSTICAGSSSEVGQIMWTIGITLVIKAFLTITTFGCVLPAGIFIPSLVVGACFGRIVGLAVEWVHFNHPALPMFDVCTGPNCVIPGIYAMIGAAATLAGVTRTTVSLAVIMFELTGTLNYVVPVMLAVLVAKTVADAIEKRGIYELVIELKKLPYLSNKEEYLWGGRLVTEVTDKDVPTLRADKPHTVRELTGRLLELVRLGYADTGFPVLVKESASERDGRTYKCLRVVGFLGINELEHALLRLADEPDATLNLVPDDSMSRPRSSVMSIFSFTDSLDGGRGHNPYDLSRYIDRAPITVQVHSPLELVQQLFVKLGARQMLVTDSRGAFRGAVYKKQWIAFLDELEQAD